MVLFKLLFPAVLALSSKPNPQFLEGKKNNTPKVISAIKTDISVTQLDKVQVENLEDKSYQQFLKENQPLVDAFDEFKKKNQNVNNAIESIKKWNPSQPILNNYKDFFLSTWSGNYEDVYKHYLALKKEKKFIRIRLELIVFLINSPIQQLKFANAVNFIQTESRSILKQLRGSSEGEVFEEEYLKWLQRNKFFDEICQTERARWIAEPGIDFVELTTAIEKCPLAMNDFLTRMRRLLFAAKEYQALREIELFSSYAKLQDWERTYIRAVYDSNQGDPVTAFKNLTKYEKELLETEYNDNYFFIAQRAGELEKAEQIIAKILAKVKGKEYQEMRFQQGFLLYQIKKYTQAHAIFDELYKNDPYMNPKKKKRARPSRNFDQISWLRGWTLYLDGQYQKAFEAFEDTTNYAVDEARLAYWMADAKLKMGDDSSAIAGFKKLSTPVLEQKSFSYYNLLAWLRYENLKKEYRDNGVLKSIALVAKMNKGPFPVASETQSYSQIMASYRFLDQETYETDEGNIQLANSENDVIKNTDSAGIDVNSEKDLAAQINWAKFLIIQNEPDLARWHLYEIEKKINTRKKAEQLAQFYLSQQFYYRALSLMNRYTANNKSALQVKSDPVMWASLYPEAYKDKVFQYAEIRKIDPYLILSIMRAETQYKSDAISPVGAVGLMQFMPYSAQKVADIMDQKIQTDQLFTPEKSIEFGAAYLKKLSLEMDNSKPLVAAAYNGGPHRVKAWIKNLGQLEFDKFIEHIPFSETRTYVKRVLTYRATYDKLYNKSIEHDKYSYLLNPIQMKLKEPISLKEEWEPFRSEFRRVQN
jgi:soluble lytic murein transglycosylase